jgi:erythromycin esterase-like protein
MGSLTQNGRTRFGADEAQRAIAGAAESLPEESEAAAFGPFFDRFADARIVLLGEATHGTAEFYRARAAITRRLIEQHGFRIVAVEADWPDAARIDRYVRHRSPEPSREQAFSRFPTWMWRNAEVLDFIDWLRAFNETRPAGDRAEFRGLDVYSLGSSISAVLDYLDKIDPEAARAARRRYGCLTPWQGDPADYGRAVLYGAKEPCEEAVVAQMRELLAKRLDYLGRDGEAFLDAAQNARIVRAAEQYYHMMYRGSTESWNLRDRHMFDTLRAVLAARGEDARAVVWAHNSHIGNAAATAMGWAGEFNIGELCRTAYGNDAVLIGFGTDRGTVAAASD